MDITVLEEEVKEFPLLMSSNNKEILMVFKETELHYEGHLMMTSNGVPFCPHRSCHEYRSDWKKEDFKVFKGKILLSN